jgi:hypothetical protein
MTLIGRVLYVIGKQPNIHDFLYPGLGVENVCTRTLARFWAAWVRLPMLGILVFSQDIHT